MEPSLNTWTVFFLVAAVQGFFLAAMIFLKRSKVNYLLGSLIIAFSTCLLFYVSFWTRYLSLLPAYVNMLMGLTYLFGPLMYFYIRSDREKAYFNSWHFVPACLYVLHFLSWSVYPQGWRTNVITLQTILQNLHLIVYTVIIFQFVLSNEGFSNGALKLYKWRKKLAFSFLGYTLSFVAYYALVWTNTLRVEYDYMISVASTFFIYFIGYHGFHRQDIFKMYEAGRYEKSALSSSASNAILDTLLEYMNTEKPYLNSSLRLQDVSEKLNMPRHYISQVINDMERKNFADFINEYRVEEAKKLLNQSDNKIIHVAYDSGFNNKVSFNSAFRKFTGMSPREFRESQSVLA